MKSTRRNGGSVVLLVVGLLTIIAMLGSTFVFISRMDRRQSKAIAESARMDGIADDIIRQIQMDRLMDLHIDGVGNSGIVYGKATKITDCIDALGAEIDPILASPQMEGNAWPRITQMGTLTSAMTGSFTAPIGTSRLSDSDGDKVKDAKLWSTGVANGSGEAYYVAVRVEDLSGRINANTAYTTKVKAEANRLFPLYSVSLENLATTWEQVHGYRCGQAGAGGMNIDTYEEAYNIRPLNPESGKNCLPFDKSDMLALAWYGQDSPLTSGRLFRALGNQFNSARRHLTTVSSSRIHVPVPVMGPTAQTYKADLNRAEYTELYNAFYNAIPLRALSSISGFSESDADHKRLAAQLAVNVIDFSDDNDEITVQTVDSKKVYGVERQPFVTEAFGKWYREVPADPAQPAKDHYYYAVEMLNPYTTPINLSDYKIVATAGGEKTLSGSIPASGRLVLVRDSGTIVVSSTGSPKVIEVTGLDLKGGATITRKVGGVDVIMGRVPAISIPRPEDNKKSTVNLIWADVLKKARYTRNIPPNELTNSAAHDYTNEKDGAMTAGNSKLGTFNTDVKLGNEEPCPVYVRNSMIVCLGDLCRILYVGPSKEKSLREELGGGGGIAVGRLDPAGGAVTYGDVKIPNIPVGALLGNYLMVGSPLVEAENIDNDGDGRTNSLADVGREDSIAGRININTASETVLMKLGGVADSTNAAGLVNAIITYRENAAAGGFTSPAELAIPLNQTNPEKNYATSNLPPLNYTLSPNSSDDGLGSTGSAKVEGDLIKSRLYYSRASNSVTVRSDVYIAYIRVQVGSLPTETEGVRYYVAVIDRSNCRRPGDLPIVRMSARVD